MLSLGSCCSLLIIVILLLISSCYSSTTDDQQQAIACTVPRVDNGNYVTNDDGGKVVLPDTLVQVGTVISLTCRGSFIVNASTNSSTKTCSQKGDWVPQSSTLSCRLKPPSCGATIAILNGRVTGGRSEPGATRNVTCNAGFEMRGASYIKCDGNLRWTQPGTCVRIGCGPVPYIENGQVRDGPSTIGTKRKIVCASGFKYLGGTNQTVECMVTGQWTTPQGRCQLIKGNCGDVPAISNGQVLDGPSTVGSRLVIICERGFKYSTQDRTVKCLPSGQWTSPRGICREIKIEGECGRVPDVRNGGVLDGPHTIGSTRQVMCEGGYKYSADDHTIKCQPSGTWSIPLGVCNLLAPTTEAYYDSELTSTSMTDKHDISSTPSPSTPPTTAARTTVAERILSCCLDGVMA